MDTLYNCVFDICGFEEDKAVGVPFWVPLECGGLSIDEGTLIVFLRHPEG
jgi:hypothetical protein